MGVGLKTLETNLCFLEQGRYINIFQSNSMHMSLPHLPFPVIDQSRAIAGPDNEMPGVCFVQHRTYMLLVDKDREFRQGIADVADEGGIMGFQIADPVNDRVLHHTTSEDPVGEKKVSH